MDAFEKFFGVVARGRTYSNTLYLLLSFPLGIFYFVFLVTGLALGIPLLILWVGLIILVAVFAAWYGLVAFERQMAIGLLGEDIPPMTRQDLSGKNLWQKFTAALANPVTWKGLVFLFAKFPLGILSFVVVVTFVSLSAALIAAPVYYRYFNPQIELVSWNGLLWNPVWVIDTLPEAVTACLIGVVLMFISLHIFNGLAWVSGKFARVMLGNFSAPAAAAVPAGVVSAVDAYMAPVAPAPTELPAHPLEDPSKSDLE